VSVAVAPGGPAAPEPEDIRVAWEDEHLLVADKPAGLVTHPAPGHRGPSLAGALRGRAAGGRDPERAGIVHRLDRDTSGLLVVARSEAAHERLVAMLARREVDCRGPRCSTCDSRRGAPTRSAPTWRRSAIPSAATPATAAASAAGGSASRASSSTRPSSGLGIR
jgi:hypothetical protein